MSTFCEAGGSSKKGLERVMRYTKKKKTVMIRMLDNDVGVSCYSLMTWPCYDSIVKIIFYRICIFF